MTEHPTSIRLPSDLKRDMKVASKEEDRPVAWLIVNVLKQWIAFRKQQKKVAK